MRPSSENLRHELRSVAKEAVWLLLNRHSPGDKRDICLFGTRRGGTTWLMEVLAAAKGVKFLDQPLEIMTGTLTAAQFRRIPKFHYGEIVSLDAEEEAALAAYLDSIFDGSLPVNAPWRFWRRDFDFRSDRLLLKIMAAKPLIDWIATRWDVEIVYLTRHPVPQSLSCIRNGWTLTAKAYLRDERFVAEHLGDDNRRWAERILASGTELERHVLNWALENLVPVRLLPHRPAWRYVSYEECVMAPEATVGRLARQLDLGDLDAMLAKIGRPSRSSKRSTERTRDLIAAGDREALLGRWRSRVAEDEERSAMAVLERLGIDLYRYGEEMPHPPARQ